MRLLTPPRVVFLVAFLLVAFMASSSNANDANTTDVTSIPGFTPQQSGAVRTLVDSSVRGFDERMHKLENSVNDSKHDILNTMKTLFSDFQTNFQQSIASAVEPVRKDVASLRSELDNMRLDVDRLKLSSASDVRVPSSDDGALPAPARQRSPDGQAQSKARRSVSPRHDRSSRPASRPPPATSSPTATTTSPGPAAHVPPAGDPRPRVAHPPQRVQGASNPDPRNSALPKTVFVSMKGTKMYTERVRAMCDHWLPLAFPAEIPRHNVIHSHGAGTFKVQFFDRSHSTVFLAYVKSHIPYTDKHGNCIDFYAKIDAPRSNTIFGKIFNPGYKYLSEHVDGFDAKEFRLSVDFRHGALLIDYRGLAYSILQTQLPDVPGGPPIVVDGDIVQRLPELVPGLTLEVLRETKRRVVESRGE